MSNPASIHLSRFPLKSAWDFLSLGQVVARPDLTIRQKLGCLGFYFSAGGIRNLYATLTRSGSHWSLLGIALARDIALGGTGEYEFRGDAWMPRAGAVYTKLDWREPAQNWDVATDPAILSVAETVNLVKNGDPEVLKRPLLFHSHLPYCRLRTCRLRGMKTAVLLRSIYDSMESKYHKHLTLLGMGVRPAEYLVSAIEPPSQENDFNFPWKQLVDDAIEFYNSWGSFMEQQPDVRLYRYDDLMASPVDTHKELSDFWGIDLPRECLQQAFSLVTKDAMKKRLPDADPSVSSRVAFRTQGAVLTEERVDYIRDRMEQFLKYDFGYGLDWRQKGAV